MMTSIFERDLNGESDEWAYFALRLALVTSLKNDDDLESLLRSWNEEDPGSFDQMLDYMLDAQSRFQLHSETLALVLARMSLTLERMGCHPE